MYDEIIDQVSNKKNFSFQENLDPSNYTTDIANVAKLVIPPLIYATILLIIKPKKDYTPHIFSEEFPLLTKSPGLVQIDGAGNFL